MHFGFLCIPEFYLCLSELNWFMCTFYLFFFVVVVVLLYVMNCWAWGYHVKPGYIFMEDNKSWICFEHTPFSFTAIQRMQYPCHTKITELSYGWWNMFKQQFKCKHNNHISITCCSTWFESIHYIWRSLQFVCIILLFHFPTFSKVEVLNISKNYTLYCTSLLSLEPLFDLFSKIFIIIPF